jgi:hypothetical protein
MVDYFQQQNTQARFLGKNLLHLVGGGRFFNVPSIAPTISKIYTKYK